MRPKGGFTVVETLAVIGIIGVVAGILSVALGAGLAKSRTRPTCANNLRQVATAYALYQGDHDGGLPQSFIMIHSPSALGPYRVSTQCPLNGRRYRDEYLQGVFSLQRKTPIKSTHLPDGRTIPTFDPTLDVLARCLEHGVGGFSRGGDRIWVISPENTKGRVLGVRLDGSVRLVSPFSCWQAFNRDRWMLHNLAEAWRGCDRPDKS